MTNRTQSLRYAGSAIAAALAIVSTSSLAQDAAAPSPALPEPLIEPVIVVPDVPASTAPQPTIVVPTNEPATVQPIPTTTVETPEPDAAPAPAANTTRTRAAAPATRAAPQPAAPVAAPEPTAAEETTVLPPVTTAEPVAPVSAVTTTEQPRAANDNTGILALVLGGLVFLALAIWGFVAIGRRRPVRRYAAETTAKPVTTVAPDPVVTTTPVVAESVPVVTEPAPVVARKPVAITSRVDNRLSGPSFAKTNASASGALPHAGASIALPARMPEDYAERDELMKRMIAAKPDRANPFTDRGARTKRARLILQSLGRDFSNSEPWIDLSQYPNNWPELAGKRSAAA